jgi:ABC-2 type transport system ATP-binding protein
VDDIMQECDVTDVADRLIGHLSKGYRQRVALCAALVHKPKVLVLDEPTEGLDPNQIVHIRQLIQKLASDRTVILSSHILSEVQATCHEVVIINKGHIAAKVDLGANFHLHHTYVYEFSHSTEKVSEWLLSQQLAHSVQQHPSFQNAIIVRFEDKIFENTLQIKEKIAHITSQMVGVGFGVVGLQEKKEGIEEIFFDVIRNQSLHHTQSSTGGTI